MMQRVFVLLMGTLLVSTTVQAEPASTQSVEKLLVVTKGESLINSIRTQMEPMMRQSAQQAVQQKSGGKPLTQEEQQAMDKMISRMAAVINSEFTWAALKPQLVALYTETFEQKEVDDIIAFYQTPSGQALIDKMPQVTQKSILMSQQLIQSIIPKMQKVVQETVEEMKAAK